MYRNAKAEMTRAGMTLKDVAEQMNKTIGTVSNWLNGKFSMSFRDAVEFKRVIKSEMSLEELFKVFPEDD